MAHRCIAYDQAGVPRVWGTGPTREVAEARCVDELAAYRVRRPDLYAFSFGYESGADIDPS